MAASQFPLKHSYFHEPLDAPFVYKTLLECLDDNSEKFPDKNMVVYQDPSEGRSTLTFRELSDFSKQFAIGLHHLGLHVNERVGLLAENDLNWIKAEYGIYRAGCVVVRMHRGMRSGEDVVSVLQRTEASALCLSFDAFETLCLALPELKDYDGKSVLKCSAVPKLRHCILVGSYTSRKAPITTMHSLLEVVSKLEEGETLRVIDTIARQITPDSIYSSYPTSGSTGVPKNVPYPYYAAVTNIFLQARTFSLTPDDVFFCDRPLSHPVGGFMIGSAACVGLTVVMLKPTVTVAQGNVKFFIKVLRDEKCNCGAFFPYLLCDILGNVDLSEISLEKGFVGGQVVSAELLQKGRRIVRHLQVGYGCTEAMWLCASVIDDTEENILKYTGRIFPGVEVNVMVVDKQGQKTPINERGEVWVRTYSRGHGYLGEQEKSKRVFLDSGWYKTSDIGSLTENGYLTIYGRSDDVIIRGTSNIMPADLESLLQQHPAVLAVQVVGVPDRRLGQEICACILLKPGHHATEKEIFDFVESRVYTSCDGLSSAPKYFLFFKDFPQTSTGKTNRREILREAVKLLNLDA